ncbi:MAG: histidine phosphatase family protein [Planctomycetes bacterium]|nr:histidine phosphatase family protein [Planctomycetota bacterium]MCB9904289.1 histidine phosphatase family protein [Planctomycetota bacterium]
MVKTLLIMRHGKSDWETSVGRDHERLLNERGRKAATRMGRHLVERGVDPDLVVSSSAVRTRETTERLLACWGGTPRVIFDRALYLTDTDGVIEYLSRTAGDAQVVLLVNHEPTCSLLVHCLCRENVDHFPTAALARVDLAIDDWQDLRRNVGTLAWMTVPRELSG